MKAMTRSPDGTQALPPVRVPKRAGRRIALWVLASWLLLWAAAALLPCCGTAFAALPHGYLPHSTAQASGYCADGPCKGQESRCVEATGYDAYVPQQAALPSDSGEFWGVLLAAYPVSVPHLASDIGVLRIGKNAPPSPVPLYLRTLRLLN
ncbi:MAG: hypothetical protein HYU77_15595 [Betaproteobacteria bacterium]|nr:hypothetical protein [Betaproteobacteria bacterium]